MYLPRPSKSKKLYIKKKKKKQLDNFRVSLLITAFLCGFEHFTAEASIVSFSEYKANISSKHVIYDIQTHHTV